MSTHSLIDRHRAALPPWSPLSYRKPLELVSGHGCTVRGGDGRDYLDFYSGVAANLLGYDAAPVREAVERQLRTGILHTSTFYLIRSQVELAERVARVSGIDDAVVFFTCSGTEAVETALLLATEYQRSRHVVALRDSYHGRSFGAVAVSGDKRWQGTGLSPLCVDHVPAAPEHGENDQHHVALCVQELEDLIDAAPGRGIAALIAEPVQGVAGSVPLAEGQLAAYAHVLRDRGALLICDEVLTGWGRTGRFWGHQWDEGVHPDLLVFAKGAAGGLTLGGVVGRREVMSSLPMPSISTFGGNPLSTAAAVATLDFIVEHDLPTRAARAGQGLRGLLTRGLAGLASVRRVQGRGLLLGVAFQDPATGVPCAEVAAAVQEECRNLGLLVGLGGSAGHCVRVMPPLTLTDEEVRRGAALLTAASREVDRCRNST
ncbi:aspartate aminotransferase family protein [Streptomyces kanamyceticus]|uniref:Aspartate aminotransferase family protein n=1 Tax=Streptomyces kanamyceticus TaxID=1967 RepID=A0A5J6GTA9_STRKN|nr:aspartate aminotransferase family protein [Streptomyces kanamyceticus]